MDFNSFFIKDAAEKELQNLNRTAFSSDNRFSKQEISSIASAIVAAIQAYDKQKTENP